MKISRPHPNVLKLARSRTRHLLYLAITGIFMGTWYYYVLGLGSAPDGRFTLAYFKSLMPTDLFGTIILVVPLALMPSLVKCLRIVARGEETIFDGNARRIVKNGEAVATFEDIEQLQIKVRAGEDQSDLIIVLRGDGKINVDSSSYRSIAALSEMVGEIVGLKPKIG